MEFIKLDKPRFPTEFDSLYEAWDEVIEEYERNLTYKEVAEYWYCQGIKLAEERIKTFINKEDCK